MKLPQRVRRQTSFFENSDSESSASDSPPASPAPPSGRGRKAAVGKPTKACPIKQPSPPSTGKRPYKKKATSPSPAATPSSSKKKSTTTPSDGGKKSPPPPPAAATPVPSSSQADKKKTTEGSAPTPTVQAVATESSPKSVSKPVVIDAAPVAPKPQVVVGTLPHVMSYSLQFPNVGIPFLLSTHHCGIRFNDGSCIMSAVSASVTTPTAETVADGSSPAGQNQTTAGCSGKKRARDAAADLPANSNTVVYINRHQHRFSVRPAVAAADNLTKLVVPSPLERKFMALMWCKDVVSSLHKRAQFGFVQGGTSLMTVASDMVDLSSVMEGAVDVADFPLPLYISDAQIDAAGTSATFELSNRTSVYPNRCYYPSDDEGSGD